MLTKPHLGEFTFLHTTNHSIYSLGFNGFYEDYTSLFHIMELQDRYLQDHAGPSLKLCTFFYNTNVTPEVMNQYITCLSKHADKIDTLAILGIPLNERGIFRLKLKKSPLRTVNFRFFSSVNDACNF